MSLEHDNYSNQQKMINQEAYKPETNQWKPEMTWRPEVEDNDDSADSDVEKEVEQILGKTPQIQPPLQHTFSDLRYVVFLGVSGPYLEHQNCI